ncbi:MULTISPECIES: hypothetical protein [Vibrio]|uniref:hypothetical protein n=1 Tax=Vibrio TaxID=662 RepID=UPI001EFC663D|nr:MULTISPECIES: hypothetical protein [Vibrio]MBE3681826.1 hypothetical protein [Vibrio parahaemolyticus]MCG9781221.1 hypothetical protein [Vibrio brasiliensis]MDC5853272.1 hypothetical protein [Vibrio europaeus]WOO27799.1 hypothetical protein R1T29_00690 [Vibrio parahaemolyticus]
MEFLIFIGVCWLLSKLFSGTKSSSSTANSTRNTRNTRNSSHRDTTSTPLQKKPSTPPQSYRPTARTSSVTNRPAIRFSEGSSGFDVASTSLNSSSSGVVNVDLSGLHDAFTGAPLDKNLGLHQCQRCKVFYHSESVTVLKEANAGQCVACPSTQIRAVNVGQEKKSGRDYTPEVITLSNYREHVGSVVTFEAKVIEVKESRRGSDFAVMFERKSWTQGFKLVFFRRAVTKVGGKPYISSLGGKTVKVRGLVVNHPKYGYQIIVSEKSMILGAR